MLLITHCHRHPKQIHPIRNLAEVAGEDVVLVGEDVVDVVDVMAIMTITAMEDEAGEVEAAVEGEDEGEVEVEVDMAIMEGVDIQNEEDVEGCH